MSPPPALVSIHDLMPETLASVAQLISLAQRHGVHRLTLLVVPGKDWSASEVDRLRTWAAAGHDLAGHGWHHHVREIHGLKHRLHARFVSRQCAEHLALDAADIVRLMQRCRQWFSQHDLPAPTLYVPPAWALGRISRSALAVTGFRLIESSAGVLDVDRGRFSAMPLLGFEARERWQVPVLTLSNRVNQRLGRWRALRIALHPHDHRLALATQLNRVLQATPISGTYTDVLGP